MEGDSNLQPEAHPPDPDTNAEGAAVDTSDETFEMTAGSLNELMKSMELLLSDVEQLRSHCSNQASDLLNAAMELKQQQDDLKESYMELSRDMQEIVDAMEALFSTKSAFEAKEQEAQKLSKQF